MVRDRLIVALLLAVVAPGALADWVEFTDETGARISADPSVAVTDTQEKDYAWGDVDKDGDIDLVIVRKEPFTSPGKRVNHLLINENGVLTDRTDDFATSSTVPGDDGFNTATNDRDVILVDVDLDGWLDMVTAVTISDGDPKHIGHPRIYMNRGCFGACAGTADWLGFRHEDVRMPTMLSYTDQAGFNPRFCSVDAGDLTGDGYPDLWFGDYDSSGAGGNEQPSGADYNDRLLINQGAANPGYFTDETNGPGGRFAGTISIPGSDPTPFPVSAFGAAANIRDINGDGRNDIVKQTSLDVPQYVGVAYNDPGNLGFFDDFEVVNQLAPYFVSVGDLNNDDKLDLVITDDGADRYMLNQGNDANDNADFIDYVFSFSHNGFNGPPFAPGDDGFGGNSVIADLDLDGWNDVLIADVDVDIDGCINRRMHVYRNLGGSPGDQIVLEEQTTGANCQNLLGNPPECVVTTIPSDRLLGVHDVAVFDINGDSFPDMVVGRCDGTEVYMNVPDVAPVGAVAENGSGGSQLMVHKVAGDEIRLSWGASCFGTDSDYEIYEGYIGDFTGHSERFCSTGGATTSDPFVPGEREAYYLVVPHNTVWEGSYGRDSSGALRGQGESSCRPMNFQSCGSP